MTLSREGSRLTSGFVAFRHAFRLTPDDSIIPAGVYATHTFEERYSSAAGPVFVATSVDLVVAEASCSTTRIVRPSELQEALRRDREKDEIGDNESPDRLAPASDRRLGH